MSTVSSVERRIHIRYKAQEELIVFSSNDICIPTDISEGGVALAWIRKGALPPRLLLDILLKNGDFRVHVPVKLVWEKNFDSFPISMFTKSFGCQFENLTDENRSKIDYLIKMHQEFKP